MTTMELVTADSLQYWKITAFENVAVTVKFYLRSGGVSDGPFSSLNHGYGLGDQEEKVKENRILAYQKGDFGPHMPVTVKQVHGIDIMTAFEQHAGQGWLNQQDDLLPADGLITPTPGLPLAIKTADCLPIALTDDQGQAIAMLHAGWRGLVGGIIIQGVKKMADLLNSQSRHILAAIGPGLSQQHFGVTRELFDQFMPYKDVLKLKGDKGYVDLPGIARQQLIKHGVLPSNIFQIPACTYQESEKYFSYRRDNGRTGRMLSMIQINP